MIANRLSSPTPLFKVARWAEQWAVEDVFGIHADFLDDDRIAPHLDELVGSIGAKAITEFGIDASRCHWDMTSVSLYGAYENPDSDYPVVKFGHPKDRRTDLKQIQAGLPFPYRSARSRTSRGARTQAPPRPVTNPIRSA